jgi:hypothetical protein
MTDILAKMNTTLTSIEAIMNKQQEKLQVVVHEVVDKQVRFFLNSNLFSRLVCLSENTMKICNIILENEPPFQILGTPMILQDKITCKLPLLGKIIEIHPPKN